MLKHNSVFTVHGVDMFKLCWYVDTMTSVNIIQVLTHLYVNIIIRR